MSPLGHLSVSYSIGKNVKKLPLTAFVIGGVLPDIDFILLPFPFFNDWHRTVTHNLCFVILVAFIFSIIWGRGHKGYFWGFFLGGLVHLFVDSILDGNPTNGIGVAILWPFSDIMFSPFNLSGSEVAIFWGNIEFKTLILGAYKMLTFEAPFYFLASLLLLKERLYKLQ